MAAVRRKKGSPTRLKVADSAKCAAMARAQGPKVAAERFSVSERTARRLADSEPLTAGERVAARARAVEIAYDVPPGRPAGTEIVPTYETRPELAPRPPHVSMNELIGRLSYKMATLIDRIDHDAGAREAVRDIGVLLGMFGELALFAREEGAEIWKDANDGPAN